MKTEESKEYYIYKTGEFIDIISFTPSSLKSFLKDNPTLTVELVEDDEIEMVEDEVND